MARVRDEADVLEEGVNPDRRGVSCSTGCRQDVVRSRVVVADGFARSCSQEDGTGVSDPGLNFPWILDDQFNVLGGDAVDQLRGLVQIVDRYDRAIPGESGLCCFSVREVGQLAVELLLVLARAAARAVGAQILKY